MWQIEAQHTLGEIRRCFMFHQKGTNLTLYQFNLLWLSNNQKNKSWHNSKGKASSHDDLFVSVTTFCFDISVLETLGNDSTGERCDGMYTYTKKTWGVRTSKASVVFFAVYVEDHKLVSSYSQVHESREMLGHQRDPLKVGSFPSSSSLSTCPFLPVISHKKRVGFLCLSTNVALLGFPWNEHPCFNVSEKLNTCYSILILWHARESWEGKEVVLVLIHLGYSPFSASMPLFWIWKWYTDTASVCIYIYYV